MRRILIAITLCIGAGEVQAQWDSGPPVSPGLIHGFSVERYQFDQSLTFSYRATRYHPGKPGFDLGVGILPHWLANGVLAGTVELGAAQASTMGSSLLFLRVGTGAFVVAGQNLGGFAPALHGGLALVVPLDPRTALRFDVGEHMYLIDHEFEPRWSLGVGFAVLPEPQ